jgi:hypothetical protein
MMLLTDAQIHAIRQIIQDHHTAFIANYISPEAVAPEILEKLKAKGLVNVKIKSIEDAYVYGILVAMMDDPKVKSMNVEQFKDYIRSHPVPLSEIEKRAVAMAQHQAAQYVVGLGNRVNQATGQLLIEADADLRAKLQTEIRDKTAENIERRESVEQLKSDLGWVSKDWARDWNRIAVTEKHNAMQAGVRDHLRERWGKEARVAKIVMPDGCPHCKRLYLGPDGMPRIFKLSVLEKHGHTNFGRKVGDWQAVTGSTHPWCQCQLVHIPPGWGFNEEGQLEPGGQLGVNYGSKEDLQMAMLREADLRKAGATRATNYAGIPIVVEQEPGSTRKWKTPEGDSGETVMQYIYGYIPATNGADDEGIDVFVGTDPNAPMAYIINQQNPETGRYDEDKVMLGFETETAARNAYRAHYDSGEFFAGITPITIDQFKRVARSTSPKEPTLFKAGQPMMPLVVPLRKGEGQTDQTPAATSQALDRSPSPGTAANHIFRVPPRPVAVDMAQTARDVIDSQKLQNQAFKRDKKIYTIHNAIRIVRPIGKPVMESGLDPEQIKMNRERLLEAGEARQAGRAINRVEIGGDDADTADDDTED